MSSKGPRPSFEDHWAQTEEEKEDLSSSKKRKNVDKAFITSAFNTLNHLTGRINEEMTPKQCHHSSQPGFKVKFTMAPSEISREKLKNIYRFMGPTILFDTIYGSHCTISTNFYLYLQYFQ